MGARPVGPSDSPMPFPGPPQAVPARASSNPSKAPARTYTAIIQNAPSHWARLSLRMQILDIRRVSLMFRFTAGSAAHPQEHTVRGARPRPAPSPRPHECPAS